MKRLLSLNKPDYSTVITVFSSLIIKADGQIVQDRSLLTCKTGKDCTTTCYNKLSWFSEWSRCPHGAHRAAGASLTLEVEAEINTILLPLPLCTLL